MGDALDEAEADFYTALGRGEIDMDGNPTKPELVDSMRDTIFNILNPGFSMDPRDRKLYEDAAKVVLRVLGVTESDVCASPAGTGPCLGGCCTTHCKHGATESSLGEDYLSHANLVFRLRTAAMCASSDAASKLHERAADEIERLRLCEKHRLCESCRGRCARCGRVHPKEAELAVDFPERL